MGVWMRSRLGGVKRLNIVNRLTFNPALLLESDSVINKIVIKSGEAFLGTLYFVHGTVYRFPQF